MACHRCAGKYTGESATIIWRSTTKPLCATDAPVTSLWRGCYALVVQAVVAWKNAHIRHSGLSHACHESLYTRRL